ncbi:MAG: DUF2079 domain-containing protein, partial [Candidatus Eremiobacteraeota bacterium]|nr:DUF2079 domain-containing protein [Candidatus Eremiobacteraeota bacterium]
GLSAIVCFRRSGERQGVAFGLTSIGASIAVFAGYFALIRPLAGAGTHWVPSHFYEWWGYAYAQPPARQIAERLTYLLEVFAPLAFIPLRSRSIVLAVPGLAEVLASREPLMYTMGQHYAGTWIPYVLVAFAVAAARLFDSAAGRRWIAASALLCALVLAFFSPLHLGHFLRPLEAQDAATEELISRIPTTTSVGTYDEIYAHLGFYPEAAIGLARHPQYVLMDERYASAAWSAATLPELHNDVQRGTYRVVTSRDGVTLFERRE